MCFTVLLLIILLLCSVKTYEDTGCRLIQNKTCVNLFSTYMFLMFVVCKCVFVYLMCSSHLYQ